jgi:glutamate carboxypeptidase
MHPFLRYATEKQPDIVRLIGQLVRCESPSDNAAAVGQFAELLIESAKDIASARLIRSSKAGPHVRLEFHLPGSHKTGQILGLGHSDTVWPLGTLAHMPFRESEGRLWGPGVLDMKAGLAFFLFAARLIRDLDIPVNKKVVLLVVSDEEVGSETSREITESEARQSDLVFVLEPGTGLPGKLKTARKGVGDYLIQVTGKASHAGVDFSEGASAILELSRQIQTVAGFTDLSRGITVNPGVIRGGTRTNVVAAHAEAEIDIRIAKAADAALLDKQFRSLHPFDSRCHVIVRGGLNRPPMERTPAIEKLFLLAQQLAASFDVTLEESATGGGSDGNFTAALGTPTLDGLGAVGEGAHASNESILIDRIADRTALLSALLDKCGINS